MLEMVHRGWDVIVVWRGKTLVQPGEGRWNRNVYEKERHVRETNGHQPPEEVQNVMGSGYKERDTLEKDEGVVKYRGR